PDPFAPSHQQTVRFQRWSNSLSRSSNSRLRKPAASMASSANHSRASPGSDFSPGGGVFFEPVYSIPNSGRLSPSMSCKNVVASNLEQNFASTERPSTSKIAQRRTTTPSRFLSETTSTSPSEPFGSPKAAYASASDQRHGSSAVSN